MGRVSYGSREACLIEIIIRENDHGKEIFSICVVWAAGMALHLVPDAVNSAFIPVNPLR